MHYSAKCASGATAIGADISRPEGKIARFVVQVRQWQALQVDESALVKMTEAARLLGLSTSALGDLVYRGVLRFVRDTSEPNPRWQGRVLRVDVEAELNRRRGRRDDGRLKRKRD